MLVNSGGGTTGTPLKANPGRIREAANEYAGLMGKAKSSAHAVTSTGQDLAGQVSHPAVQAAIAGAVDALMKRVVLVGMGFDHCDTNLTATAKDYEDSDNRVAARMHGGGHA